MNQGKYDPPDKAKTIAENPSVCTLMDVLYHQNKNLETSFEKLEEHADEASRARAGERSKKGRKSKVTANVINLVCECLNQGESERTGCIKAGIGLTAWNRAKKQNPVICQKIEEARLAWANLNYIQRKATLYESQMCRWAGKKAKRPQPTKQARMIQWQLTLRVPLNYAAIPDEEVKKACEQYSCSLETWKQQASAFGLWNKIYDKRAKLRGDNLYKQPQVYNQPMQYDNEDRSLYSGFDGGAY